MIQYNEGTFYLETRNTSYIFRVLHEKYLEHLYYGRKLRRCEDISCLTEKHGTGYGNSVVTPEDETLTLENICLEFSSSGTGDYRQSCLELKMPDGSYSNRFEYAGYEVYDGGYQENEMTGMPYSRNGSQALEVKLVDSCFPVEIKLVYTVFEECDVITRRMVLKNQEVDPVVMHRFLSMQLDFPETDYRLETLDGLWTRERKHNTKELVSGIYVNDSMTGSSSNRHNPFIVLSKEGCTEENGDCFGMNLIYSGNHYEAVEVSEYGKLRVVAGINPFQFRWELSEGESFYTPEAVLSFSKEGKNGLSHQYHQFIKEHIVSPDWKEKERPVLLNNWEATYFDFTKGKLLKLAKAAKKLGVELFVLDDGWFGERNDDKTSLGDWFVNEKKLGGTLAQLSEEVHKQGLMFGLWVEPEMISKKSRLFEEHPEYAVVSPGRSVYAGRNQLVLDYTREDVRDYVVEVIKEVLSSAQIEYVKWDMNRHISDAYSGLLGQRQGEFYHRYLLGLYDVMNRLTKCFPEILFESCSSGGNRFDLGMLFYMPQVWTSDNTDANERVWIQEGTSYGYPQGTMGAHVSVTPNHQTLRSIGLETRFEVACFGLLGYELDVTKLNTSEQKIIKEQIAFYKENRKLFQNGIFTRSKMANGTTVWQVTASDKSEAAVLIYRNLTRSNSSDDILKIKGLDLDGKYRVTARKQALSIKQFGNLVNQVTPVSIVDGGVLQSVIDKVYQLETEEETYAAYGDMLEYAGVKLMQKFTGTGYNEKIRIMEDFSSRMYLVKKIEE